MDLKTKVLENQMISKQPWFDMEIIGFDRGKLIIAGSIDFSYGHIMEVIFEDVFHATVNREWKTNTSTETLHIVDNLESSEINLLFQIEQGYTLFKIIFEDLSVPFYISAKNVDFNTDKVFYYKKDYLAENERIANWVK